MSYATKLADILVDVTKSSQARVETMEDGIRAYMIDYARRGCSMRTMFTAYVDLTRFSEDVVLHDNDRKPLPLHRLTRHMIEAHLARLAAGKEVKCTKQPSPYTVERRRRVVKAFLRWLVSEEYMTQDPTKKLSSIPLRERFPSVWTLADVQRFLRSFDTTDLVGHRNYTMSVLALSSGLRAGELSHLRPVDVDLTARTLSVSDRGKTGARTAVMSTSAATELAKWMRRRERELLLTQSHPLFPSVGLNGLASTEPMRASSMSYIIYKHAKQAGITGVKLGAHALRHTAASHLARKGASAFEIQRFLGHSSIEMSQRYVSMANETVQHRIDQDGILSQLEKQNRDTDCIDEKEVMLKRILQSR